jgi:hypothetical protein
LTVRVWGNEWTLKLKVIVSIYIGVGLKLKGRINIKVE